MKKTTLFLALLAATAARAEPTAHDVTREIGRAHV